MALVEVVEDLSALPPWLLLAVLPLLLPTILLGLIRTYTAISFNRTLAQHRAASSSDGLVKGPVVLVPPTVPYTLPFLGHALGFLGRVPGLFYTRLFATVPREVGVCTLLLGGRRMHLCWAPQLVQTLLRQRSLLHHTAIYQIAHHGFGCSADDTNRYFGFGTPPGPDGRSTYDRLGELDQAFLLRADRVNELTEHFMTTLQEDLATIADSGDGAARDVGLYQWLWPRLFASSVHTFFGSGLLEVYPAFPADFRAFDEVMTSLFFGLPRWIIPSAHARRARMLDGLVRWQEAMLARTGGEGCIVDPDADGIAWEPHFGSRQQRAKHRHYISEGMTPRGRASADAAFFFALSSNAIPAAGWMLAHLLDPRGDPTLLPRVRAELQTVPVRQGIPDAGKLAALPLLQAVYSETLRLYDDLIVTRDVQDEHGLTVALDEGRQRAVHFRKGDCVFMSTWVGHHSPVAWSDPPADAFRPERFLAATGEKTDKPAFSTAGTAGRFYPFGGGRPMCPGRNFAKQEVLGAVALVLLNYEFEVVGFRDRAGRPTDHFIEVAHAGTGSGIIPLGGDMEVRIRKREGLGLQEAGAVDQRKLLECFMG